MRATIDLCPSPRRRLVENIPQLKMGAGHSPNWRWFRVVSQVPQGWIVKTVV